MNCITRYLSFAKITNDENLYEKSTMSSFLHFLLGEDLTGYQLPSDLGSKSALYDRLISEMLGRYWEKPIGKTFLPPWEEEIPQETIDKIIASWTRRFLGVLNRTHERYILLLESYAGAKSKMMDDVKSTTSSKRKYNDTPQNPNTEGVYEGDNYITDFTKFDTENATEFATKMQRLKELDDLYFDVMDEWVDEFQKTFLEVN